MVEKEQILSWNFLDKHQHGITIGVFMLLLCIPPIFPSLFPIDTSNTPIPFYVQGAYNAIQQYCKPGAYVMTDTGLFQTAYQNTKQGCMDVLSVIFSKMGPNPGAGIKYFYWATNDWGKGSVVFFTQYCLPTILKTAARLSPTGYTPIYGQDYAIFGWYPGDLVVGSAIADDVHAFLKYDFYGSPIEQLPVMNGVLTGKDVALVYHLGTSGMSETNIWYARYKTPIISTHSSNILSIAATYFSAGMYKGAVMDMQGAAQFELICQQNGLGTITGLGLVAAKGGYPIMLYMISLIVIGNIVYWNRRLKKPR